MVGCLGNFRRCYNQRLAWLCSGGKAEKALDSIRNMLSAEAMALREGKTRMIPAEELVPGDVVLLQSGDKIPADIRLCDVKNLRVEEAPLTGESVPVDKIEDTVDVKAQIGDRKSMAYPALSSSPAAPRVSLWPPEETPNWAISTKCSRGSRRWKLRCSADREVRQDPHHHNPHRLCDHLRLRATLPGHRLCRHVQGRCRSGCLSHSGGSARHRHHYPGHRSPAYGRSPRHHPPTSRR